MKFSQATKGGATDGHRHLGAFRFRGVKADPQKPGMDAQEFRLDTSLPLWAKITLVHSFDLSENSGEPCRTAWREIIQRVKSANLKFPPTEIIGHSGALTNLAWFPTQQKAADGAATRVNGQFKKFAGNQYHLAALTAIAGGLDG